MFGFSGSELLVVMVVAVMVIGPKDLPVVIRSVRKIIQKIKKVASEFTQEFMGEEMTDLKQEAAKLNQDINRITDLKGDLQDTYSLDDVMPYIREPEEETDKKPKRKTAKPASKKKKSSKD